MDHAHVAWGLSRPQHGAILAVVLVIGVVPLDVLRYVCASALILFGFYKLAGRRHPRWVGMRVGVGDLIAWSFLMASAHGAGLMLVPILLRLSSTEQMHGAHAHGTHHADTAA